MITVEEILKELRAGQDLDSIGRDIADTLNDAKELFDKEEAARIQKEKEQKARENKLAEGAELFSKMISYLHNYYPALYKELFSDDDYDCRTFAQDITAALDLGESIYEDPKLKKAILGLGNNDLFGLGSVQETNKKGPKCSSTNFIDVLSSFLDE